MLKSCQYCGKIHDKKYNCGKKPTRQKIQTRQNTFRSTNAWKNKSIEIRERDQYLCQICFRKLYGTKKQYNDERISVHHIIPIHEEWDSRLDNEKLISLCEEHHEAAERGKIPRQKLLLIAKEQEEKQLQSPPDLDCGVY